eukprot:4035876-Alexandrium_andersonii.AAC.1
MRPMTSGRGPQWHARSHVQRGQDRAPRPRGTNSPARVPALASWQTLSRWGPPTGTSRTSR